MGRSLQCCLSHGRLYIIRCKGGPGCGCRLSRSRSRIQTLTGNPPGCKRGGALLHGIPSVRGSQRLELDLYGQPCLDGLSTGTPLRGGSAGLRHAERNIAAATRYTSLRLWLRRAKARPLLKDAPRGTRRGGGREGGGGRRWGSLHHTPGGRQASIPWPGRRGGTLGRRALAEREGGAVAAGTGDIKRA
jgi:hypothetical protein